MDRSSRAWGWWLRSQEAQRAGAEVRWKGGGQSYAQWRLLFLVTHRLVTSKAGRQHILGGRKPPPSSTESAYCGGVEGSLVGTTQLLRNLLQFEKYRKTGNTLGKYQNKISCSVRVWERVLVEKDCIRDECDVPTWAPPRPETQQGQGKSQVRHFPTTPPGEPLLVR